VKTETSDPDGDKVKLTFASPLDATGKWQTKAGDKGSREVKITASDGVNEVTQEVLLEVMKKNTAPVISSVTLTPTDVVLKKPGDKVTLKIKVDATDADKDSLKITYSGFMTSAEKVVAYGEKGGTKKVTVTVSDGKESVSKDITFEMNNWPCFDCKV
jgi:predicted secreted protein